MTNKTWRQWTLHVITTLDGERLERIIGPRMHDEIAEVIEMGALNEAEERVRYYRNEWESACERARYGKELQTEVERLKDDNNKMIDVIRAKQRPISQPLKEEIERLKLDAEDAEKSFQLLDKAHDITVDKLALKERQLVRAKAYLQALVGKHMGTERVLAEIEFMEKEK